MSWHSPEWQIPLKGRPEISAIGLGIHGHKPLEHFLLPHHWALHLYSYQGELSVDNCVLPISPGYVSVLPPNIRQSYRYQGRSVHFYTHFRLREAKGASNVSIPAMQNMEMDFGALTAYFEQTVAIFSNNRLRAEIRLWEILWQLAERPRTSSRRALVFDPAIQRAMELIELRLGEKISIKKIAHEVSLSHSHLIRLFQKKLGSNIVEHIRNRRVQRANHLLTHSTLSIKAIANEVGIPDLHAFNKIMRRVMGVHPASCESPRLRSVKNKRSFAGGRFGRGWSCVRLTII